MIRFSDRMVAERVQPFWGALQAGEFLTDAAAVAGTHRWRGLKWLREASDRALRRVGRIASRIEPDVTDALGRVAFEQGWAHGGAWYSKVTES